MTDNRSHVLTVLSSTSSPVQGVYMNHSANCSGADCPYGDMEVLMDALSSKAKGGEVAPGSYKITGGKNPVAEPVDQDPEPEPSPGAQDPEELPDVYALHLEGYEPSANVNKGPE